MADVKSQCPIALMMNAPSLICHPVLSNQVLPLLKLVVSC